MAGKQCGNPVYDPGRVDGLALKVLHDVQEAVVDIRLFDELDLDLVQVTQRVVENGLLALGNARDTTREWMDGMMSSKGKRLVLRRLRREGLNGPNRTLARLQGPTEDVRRAGRTAEASGDGRVRARRRRHAREKAARGVDGRGHLGSNRLMDRKRAGVVVVRVRLSQLPFSGLPLRRLSIALFGGVTLPLPRFSLPQVEVSHLTLALFHGRSRAGMGVRRMLGQGGQRLGGSRLRRRREMGRRRLSWLLREPGQRCDRVTSLLTRSIERGWRWREHRSSRETGRHVLVAAVGPIRAKRPLLALTVLFWVIAGRHRARPTVGVAGTHGTDLDRPGARLR